MTTATKPKNALATWEEFQSELAQREQEITNMLPPHVNRARFMASAVAAVKQTPGLLGCTPRSLFGAVTKSAQDGLFPDGREGVIVIYKEKQKDNSWLPVAQWNPMTFGLRKRAKELDGIIVDAQVVYENDTFVWHQGDDASIEHEPAPLGTDRGRMIGAYAIFRDANRNVIAREVMDLHQIEAVRSQSKAPDSLMWKKFTTEAWRKVVIRRGFKAVPCSEGLQTVVERDDDTYTFDGAATTDHPRPKAAVVQAQPKGTGRALPPVAGEKPMPVQGVETRDGTTVVAGFHAASEPREEAPPIEGEATETAAEDQDSGDNDWNAFARDGVSRLQNAATLDELEKLRSDLQTAASDESAPEEVFAVLDAAFHTRRRALAPKKGK